MFDIFSQPAGFDIGETGLLLYDASQPLWRAFLVGLGNTLRVALPALVWASALGVLLALGRLSPLPMWRRVATVLVEVHRNTPLLLQLLVWYFLLVAWLPESNAAWPLAPGLWLSKGGLSFPWWGPVAADTANAMAGDPAWGWAWPEQGQFNVVGGAAVTPEYLSIFLALSHYTAAFLAEVVRGGLLSVPRGLIEVAETLGATPWQRVRLVWLPQALRAIVPSATNQYLNLIKNSSLAVAVGYPDLVSVGNTALNQTGQAFTCLGTMMAVYLVMSLLTSAFMNWFNRRYAMQGVRA
jgi:general L-amino acid transport system permease protein